MQKSSDSLSERFGKYELLERVGVGATSEVFKAKVTDDTDLDKFIAIKRVLPHVCREDDFASLILERAKLAALANHPNVVKVLDSGRDNNVCFLVMEFLEGKDLKTLLRDARRPLPLQFALYITSQICTGLEYLHNLEDAEEDTPRLIYRAITPQNIFVTCSGEVKLLDLGVSHVAGKNCPREADFLNGKASYLSPEQATGGDVGVRSDVFSVGTLLYEMIAGMRMFHGEATEVLEHIRRADFIPLELLAPGMSLEVYEVVRSAVARDPGERYGSCAEMTSALKRCLVRSATKPSAESLASYLREIYQPDCAPFDGSVCSESSKKAKRSTVIWQDSDLGQEEKTSNLINDDTIGESYVPLDRERSFKAKWLGAALLAGAFAAGAIGVLAVIVPSRSSKHAEPTKLVEVSAVVPVIEKKGFIAPPDQQEIVATASGEKVAVGKDLRQLQDTIPIETVTNGDISAPDLDEQLQKAIKLGADEPEKAIELIEKTIQSDTGNGRAYFELAKLYAKMNSYAKAIELYNHAQALDPRSSDIPFNLGYLYAKTKRFLQSEKMYLRAAMLAPPYLDEVYFNLAMVQRASGKKKESVQSLKKVLLINPQNEKALAYLARAKSGSKR